MAELDPKAVYTAMQEDSKKGPLSRTLLVARVIAIAAAVGGAVPTAITLYQSWAHGIPYEQVSHRLKQYDIWVRNFECNINYRALTIAKGTRIDAGICESTGDVAIKVTPPRGKPAYEWLDATQLQKASVASVWGLIVGTAQAQTVASPAARVAQATPPPPAPPTAAPGTISGMQVLCQAMPSRGILLRVVKEGPKCFRETVSLFRGTQEKREEVPCTTTCK